MALNLKVTLQCKPVVWQYLLNKYGADCILPEQDWIKLLIYSMLQRATDKDAKDITLQFYTKAHSIPISLEVYNRFGDQLTPSAIRQINNRIEDVIHQQLYQFLEFYVHVCQYTLNAAIEMFQQQYNFPPEIYTHDAIKKYYQRKVQPHVQVTAKKFVGVNVPIKQKQIYKRRS